MTPGEVRHHIESMATNTRLTFYGINGSITIYKSGNHQLYINDRTHFRATAINAVMRIKPDSVRQKQTFIVY